MGFIDSFKHFSQSNDNLLDDKLLIQKLLRKNFFLSPDSSIEEAIKNLRNRSLTGMPVVDNDLKLVGFFSEQDCLRYLYGSFYFNEQVACVGDLMATEVKVINEFSSLEDILKLFIQNPFHVYPVLNVDGKYLGLLTRTDLLAEIYAIMDHMYQKSSAA